MAKTSKKKTAAKPAKASKVKAKPAVKKSAGKAVKTKPKSKPVSPAKKKPVVKAKSKPAAAKPAPKVKSAPAKPVKKVTAPAKPAAKPVQNAAPPVKAKTVAPPVKTKVAKPEPETVVTPPVAAPEPVRTSRSRSKNPPQIIDPDIPVIHLDKPPADLKESISKLVRKKIAPGERRLVKTDTINPHIIKDKPLEETGKKPKPEPKGKFVMEYILHAPVALLYDFLTTPNGMAEWFADGVDLKNDTYLFDWDGAKQEARIVSAKLDSHIRLRWLDKPEGTYFEFQINSDELTGEIQLMVTDFGDSEEDIITSRRLWETQIGRLKKALGSY